MFLVHRDHHKLPLFSPATLTTAEIKYFYRRARDRVSISALLRRGVSLKISCTIKRAFSSLGETLIPKLPIWTILSSIYSNHLHRGRTSGFTIIVSLVRQIKGMIVSRGRRSYWAGEFSDIFPGIVANLSSGRKYHAEEAEDQRFRG